MLKSKGKKLQNSAIKSVCICRFPRNWQVFRGGCKDKANQVKIAASVSFTWSWYNGFVNARAAILGREEGQDNGLGWSRTIMCFWRKQTYLLYYSELKISVRELLLHSTHDIWDGKQVSLLGIPSGTNLGVGSVIIVPLSLLLAWVDRPGPSLVFLIHRESGGGTLVKMYLWSHVVIKVLWIVILSSLPAVSFFFLLSLYWPVSTKFFFVPCGNFSMFYSMPLS